MRATAAMDELRSAADLKNGPSSKTPNLAIGRFFMPGLATHRANDTR